MTCNPGPLGAPVSTLRVLVDCESYSVTILTSNIEQEYASMALSCLTHAPRRCVDHMLTVFKNEQKSLQPNNMNIPDHICKRFESFPFCIHPAGSLNLLFMHTISVRSLHREPERRCPGEFFLLATDTVTSFRLVPRECQGRAPSALRIRQ